MTSHAIPFDTLSFVRKLETAGVPPVQAEAQAEALADVFKKVEESRLQELATKRDILLLERDIKEVELKLEAKIETAKVETIKWVVATGIVILGGVAALNRPFPHAMPAQEMRLPAPPTLPVIPAPAPPAIPSQR
ncbi:MAG: hypothetical protein H7839_10710 [Magnetococcus sp. YQC-5]